MASTRTRATGPSVVDADPTAGSTVNVGIGTDVHVPNVTHFMEDIAQVAIMTPMGDPNEQNCIWGAPSCFWGLPSTAKSDKVEQAAQACMLPYDTIIPSQHLPEDFAGVLTPTQLGLVMHCVLQSVNWLNEQGHGVLFIDEASGATPQIQGPMLRMVHKRIVGYTRINPKIRIILAANPPKYSTSGWSMTPPMANRMAHFQVMCPPIDKWIAHMTTGGLHNKLNVTFTENIVRERWGSAYGKALGGMVGFMHSNPLFLHIEPEPEHPQSGYCWPSPRSWALAARMLATANILGKSEEVQTAVVEACVGEGAGFSWYTWQRQYDLPPPEEVLKNGFRLDNTRLDVAYAILASTSQYITNQPDRAKSIQAAIGGWNLLKNFQDNNMGDLAVPMAAALVQKDLSRNSSPEVRAASDPVIKWMIAKKLLNYADD